MIPRAARDKDLQLWSPAFPAGRKGRPTPGGLSTARRWRAGELAAMLLKCRQHSRRCRHHSRTGTMAALGKWHSHDSRQRTARPSRAAGQGAEGAGQRGAARGAGAGRR